jgi:hypothetical protein
MPLISAMSSGIILVFDMDGVITPHDGFMRGKSPIINPVIKDILTKAHKARLAGEVAGIYLLTKNSSDIYVELVDLALGEQIGGISGSRYFFFNDGLYRDKFYTNIRGYPQYLRTHSKIMADIELMTGPLMNTDRVFFFDDHPEIHPELEEVLGENFIKITPPFKEGTDDKTDYSALPEFLRPSPLQGGRRMKKTRRKHMKRRKTKKSGKK